MGDNDSSKVANFLIRIAEEPEYKTQYEQNPTKILDEAGIPEEKKAEIMSGDIGKVQGAVGVVAVCFVLTHHSDQ
jgi:hypothetical protein